MAHESISFTEIFNKYTENNPPYPDGQATAVVITPHQRRGGKIVEFTFQDTPAVPAQAIAQRNFADALQEWGCATDAYRLLPPHELVIGSVALDFQASDELALSPRQVLAAIESAPHVHVDFLQADEQIG